MSYIFKVLYVISHAVYTIFHLFYVNLIHVNVAMKTLFNEFQTKTERVKNLETRLHLIDKRPKHLVIILGAEKNNFKNIAKIIIWCISSQISYISFYDYNGKDFFHILSINPHSFYLRCFKKTL